MYPRNFGNHVTVRAPVRTTGIKAVKALHDYIFLFEFIISISTKASLLALAKSINFQHQLKNRIIHRKAKGSVSEQLLFVIS